MYVSMHGLDFQSRGCGARAQENMMTEHKKFKEGGSVGEPFYKNQEGITLSKKLRKLLKGTGGFTLLELIVVITLMGFLIAILAPRLANMTDVAVDMQCDNNKQRLTEIVSTFITMNNRLPDGLVSLAVKDTTDAWTISSDDGNPANGPEFLSREMADNNNLGVLTVTEADTDLVEALIDMGISKIYYYKDMGGTDPDAKWVLQDPIDLTAATFEVGLAVVGYDGEFAAGAPALADGAKYSNAGLIGRILLGVHSECELVENGMISNAGVYADAQRKTEYYKYGYYTIIMPRFEDQATALDGITVNAFLDTNDNDTKDTGERVFTLADWDAEEIWDYYVMCPEGHKFHMSIDGEHLYILYTPTP